ncbi:MAG: DUF4012 domain-containing protein [Patescibacteria group bacterium]
MRDKKLKIDQPKGKRSSPYIIDLRPKEKKEINLLPLTKIFKKILIFFGLSVIVFTQFVFVYNIYLQINYFKKGLLLERDFLLENFFDGFVALGKLDLNLAEEKLTPVEKKLSEKIEKINQISLPTKIFLKIYPRAKSNFALLNVIYDSTKAGIFLIKTAKELPSLFEDKIETKANQILPTRILSIDFLAKLNFLQKKNNQLLFFAKRIEKNLLLVEKKYLPFYLQSPFEIIKKEFPQLRKKIDDFNIVLENLKEIVGQRSIKRYLILFQNNNEIRPTGGFLGTYALVDFVNGKIKNFEMPAGGTYDLAGQLTVKIAPPKPLLIAYPKWQFHDANWFPDWPTSARKLIWFFEKSGGPTVDGVIAINAEIMPEILKIIGEISMPEYDKVLNEENFILEIQKVIEKERKEKEKPKQILVDLTPIILNKIFSLEVNKFLSIIKIFNQGLQEKKILFYFTDKSLEDFFREKNLTGEIKMAPLDYLMINVANVNGAKTEGKIWQKIFYQAEIQNDGSILSTLIIKRKHQGIPDEPFFGKKDISWIRAYLPKGSLFLGTKSETKISIPLVEGIELDKDLMNIEKEITIDKFSGLRITEEFDKTCFGNFLEISPGEEKEISLKYLLPFKLDLTKELIPYSLLIQKQPGRKSDFEGEIILPEEKNIVWAYPSDEIKKEGKIIKISSIIEKDKVFAFILE